ncbi:MAG: GNAT family N-acetyltransferase [Propionibacteriaceae bacterium]|jgi:ribosomal protein S18 acetylase RimI-like enzyme|nr:GNAT family N-acetyltransferase [Propionibacteriaceae bacterium]
MGVADTSVRIREIHLSEVREMRQTHRRAWLETYPNDEYGVSLAWVGDVTDAWLTPESLAQWRGYLGEAMTDPNQYSRVADLDGRIVGLLHALREPEGRVELRSIYVDPSCFGQGVGPALFEAFEAWAGPAAIWLGVAVYNHRAIKFYQRRGFAIVPGSQRCPSGVIPMIDMAREPTP